MLVVRVLLIFSRNIDLDGAEFTFVHYLQQLLSGKPLYTDPENYPYSAVLYTPLYLYIVYGICKIFSFNYVHDIYEIFVAGRILSFAFVLVSLYYIDMFTLKRTQDKFNRLFMVCTFLILLTGHAYAMRPDSMKIAFFIIFLYCYIEYFYYSGNKKNLAVSLAAALVSISAKQDAIVYILLVQTINFLCLKKIRPLLILIISSLIFSLFFAFLRAVYGDACIVSLFNFNLQTISNYRESYNLYVVIFNTLRLLPLYVISIYNIKHFKGREEHAFIKLISWSVITAGITTTFFLFRPGSYLNYSYELIVLLMPALIVLFCSQPHGWIFKYGLTAYLGLLFISNILLKNYAFHPTRETSYTIAYKQYKKMRSEMLPLLRRGDRIFSPDLELTIFLADKDVLFGQEYHIDRLIYGHLGLKTTSHLLLNSSKKYDQTFLNGSVKYMIAFDKKETGKLMKEYYPKYKFSRRVNKFLLFEYVP
jgi:hypothetical protein